MFSLLTQRLGSGAVARLDLVVEFATLGGYGVDDDGVFALEQGAADDGVRALAFAGPGAAAPVRADGGVATSAGPAWGERTRGDCSPAGTLTGVCPGGAARP